VIAPKHSNRKRHPGAGKDLGDMPTERRVKINLNEGSGSLSDPGCGPGFQTGELFDKFRIHPVRISEGRGSLKFGMMKNDSGGPTT